ncbi:hypothetical protein GCM10010439_23210 [Actinocorallia aurantiaca]|uniref:Pyrrolo-quinoline quinone repeat domain-containing protein n=1 Tax=Actinocorallia aurantiaca TaxID=46204 RepID=A0ABP6GND0_9ACTN
MSLVLFGGIALNLALGFQPWNHDTFFPAFLLVTACGLLLFFLLVRRKGVPRRGLSAGALAFFTLVAAGSGYVLFQEIRYDELEKRWAIPADVPKDPEWKGYWVTGDALVRARVDGVFAHGLKDGKELWNHRVSAPEEVCGTSSSADEGVGLVSSATKGGICDRVTALDLNTGRPLWTHGTSENPDEHRGYLTGVAADSGIAAVFSSVGLDVLDLRTGEPRRTPRPPSGCRPRAWDDSLALDGGRVAAVFFCAKDDSVRLVVNELGTGSSWSAVLGTGVPLGEASVLSADPVVVRSRKTADVGRELLVFEAATGRRLAALPADTLARDLPVLVGEERIHTVVDQSGTTSVRALSFTGEILWSARFEDGVEAVHLTGSELLVAASSGGAPAALAVLDPASGAETHRSHVPRAFSRPRVLELHSTPELALFIDPGSWSDAPETQAFGSWKK